MVKIVWGSPAVLHCTHSCFKFMDKNVKMRTTTDHRQWKKDSEFTRSWSLEMPGYRRVSDRLIEVKYNDISKVGNRKGDRIHLIEFTVIQWSKFRDFDRWLLKRGWPLNRGPLNRGSTVFWRGFEVKISVCRTSINYSETFDKHRFLHHWLWCHSWQIFRIQTYLPSVPGSLPVGRRRHRAAGRQRSYGDEWPAWSPGKLLPQEATILVWCRDDHCR